MIARRAFCLVGAGWGLAATAQAASPRIMVLASSTRQADAASIVFARALNAAGVRLGQQASLDVLTATSGILYAQARMIAAQDPSVVVTFGISALRAMREATQDLPIVSGGADPVELGLAHSYAEPRGNVTGIAALHSEGDSKRLELMAELLPGSGRLAALVVSDAPLRAPLAQSLQETARRVDRDLVIVETARRRLGPALFAQLKAEGVVGVLVTASPLYLDMATNLVQLSQGQGVPLVCPWHGISDRGFGCVLAIGASPRWFWSRLAAITSRVLQGEPPGRIPVEMPTEFSTIVNLAAARRLGIEVSPMSIARAEKVVD